MVWKCPQRVTKAGCRVFNNSILHLGDLYFSLLITAKMFDEMVGLDKSFFLRRSPTIIERTMQNRAADRQRDFDTTDLRESK